MVERYAFAWWLSKTPPVLFTCNWYPREAPRTPAAETEVTHIWIPGRSTTPAEHHDQLKRLREVLPRWNHFIGCSDDLLLLEETDPNIIPFHEHLMVSPEAWPIIPDCPKYYDAVLQAAAVSWKRHWLARDVTRLLLVMYAHDPADPAVRPYTQHVMNEVRHAVQATPDGKMLPPEHLSGYLNQSRVGLALSDAEGGCRAVAEYQLSGLPVVSTIHRGGRMALVDPSHMAIVPPEEKAISAAVTSFVLAQRDPVTVRKAFLRRLEAARAEACDRFGVSLMWPQIPLPPFTDMLFLQVPDAKS